MAYIEIRSSSSRFHCGGSIINTQFVLTAGHCVCDALPCKVNKWNQMEHRYDPRGKLIVYVGFRNVMLKGNNSNNVFNVIWLKVHEKYRRDFHDLALLKVDRKFSFGPKIGPICISKDENLKDFGIVGHVAGWGHVKNQECHTSLHGPTPFSQCAFPFKWLGKTYASCAKVSTPSASNELCQSYARSKRSKFFQDKAAHMNIFSNETNERLSTCHTFSPGKAGWCATCTLGVKKSHSNYCWPKSKLKKRFAKFGLDENWGICKTTCSPSQKPMSKSLQEVRLSVFDIETCSQVLKRSKSSYNIGMELCAGKINRLFVSNIFMATNGKTKTFFHDPSKKNTSVIPIIGGQDSCLGDSGGPLWTVLSDERNRPRAYLIGVVSRGLNCASNDAPGIYVRLKSYLEWIYKHAKDGKCNQKVEEGEVKNLTELSNAKANKIVKQILKKLKKKNKKKKKKRRRNRSSASISSASLSSVSSSSSSKGSSGTAEFFFDIEKLNSYSMYD